MDKEHIQELREALNRALSELAAIAESSAMPYKVRIAAMQLHVDISAKARETISHLLSTITPSGVIGVTLKGADLVATLGKQAERASNAAVIGDMREFRSGPDEHLLAEPGERPDKCHADAVRMRGLVKGGSGETTDADPAGPQHTETFKNAAMPYVPTSFVTANWRRKHKADRDWFDVNE